MKLYRWNEVAEEQLNPLMTRQMIHTERMTIARLQIRKGAVVPLHSHENEQVSTIERGSLVFNVNGEEFVLKAGESLVLPSNVPHSARAEEDCVAVDVFTPVREDWARGDDAYLRR